MNLFRSAATEKILRAIEAARQSNAEELNLRGQALTELPVQLGQLHNLKKLRLSNNRLTRLPAEIGQLTNLRALDLAHNQLTELPPQIGQLVHLQNLNLGWNQLTELPLEIGELLNLRVLKVQSNQLIKLTPQVGQLIRLQELDLTDNRLMRLPMQVGQLNELTKLYLHQNQFDDLPAVIGQLARLQELGCVLNPLTKLPKEVVAQGNDAILTYLRALAQNTVPAVPAPSATVTLPVSESTPIPVQPTTAVSSRLRRGKLVLVGEGGTGKTSLLRRLRGERFNADEMTTRGMTVEALKFPHPFGGEMTLNAWDFSGQEIYHATHQFFLSSGALFLLVWNARLGWQQGRLTYWLEMIHARAPKSPIVLVATHMDQVAATLPLAELRARFPQIVASVSVSNATGQGVDDVRALLTEQAAALKSMDYLMPATWAKATDALRGEMGPTVSLGEFRRILLGNGVSKDSISVLAGWLHELGDILYFPDDPDLGDWVVIRPSWVSTQLGKVLSDVPLARAGGILTLTHLVGLWPDMDMPLRTRLLRLMQRFDLAYVIPDDPDSNVLIVGLLPDDEPDYRAQWQRQTGSEMRATYRFESSLPAGVPAWFIAREHRFTTGVQWRSGVLLTDGPSRALLRADSSGNSVHLTVRGPQPQSFFALLKDGFDLTLARYPGLAVRRLRPCPGMDGGKPCSHEFDVEKLEAGLSRTPPRLSIPCPDCETPVNVRELLYGYAPSKDNALNAQDILLTEIRRISERQTDEARQLRSEFARISERNFRMQQLIRAPQCPTLFTLAPVESGWLHNPLTINMELQLLCQHPDHWHPVSSGRYEFGLPRTEIQKWLPHMRRATRVLKMLSPALGPAGAPASQAATLVENLDRMSSFLRLVAPDADMDDEWARGSDNDTPQQAEGADLRSLQALLERLDPSRIWGGLACVFTPEGDSLWLCAEHQKAWR